MNRKRLIIVLRQITICLALCLFASTGIFAEKAEVKDTLPVELTKIIVKLDLPGIKSLTAEATKYHGIKPGKSFPSKGYEADEALEKAIRTTADKVLKKLKGTDYNVNHVYTFVPYIALEVSADALTKLTKIPEVVSITDNEARPIMAPIKGKPGNRKNKSAPGSEVQGTQNTNLSYTKLNDTVGLTGADAAWAMGFDGSGWFVAIIDCGLRSGHDMFDERAIAGNIIEACFSIENECHNNQSFDSGTGAAAQHPSNYQYFDHGTRGASIAVGDEGYGPNGPIYGIAKGAGIIPILVCSKNEDDPNNPFVTDHVSDVGRALEYIYTLRTQYPIAAVNISLGYDLYNDQCQDVFQESGVLIEDAISNLTNAGIAVVTAVGNRPDVYNTSIPDRCGNITFPSCIPEAIAVGASNDNDEEFMIQRVGYEYGSRWHSLLQDLYAPGVELITATGISDNSYVDAQDQNDLWSGTSLAAPHVTGAWAIIKQARPDCSLTEILTALKNTGQPILSNCAGATNIPRINIDDAILALPIIEVTEPSTGDRIDAGSTASIQWNSNQITGYVSITVIGPNFLDILVSKHPYDGSPYVWNVSSFYPSGDYRILVHSLKTGVNGYSDYFRIFGYD